MRQILISVVHLYFFANDKMRIRRLSLHFYSYMWTESKENMRLSIYVVLSLNQIHLFTQYKFVKLFLKQHNRITTDFDKTITGQTWLHSYNDNIQSSHVSFKISVWVFTNIYIKTICSQLSNTAISYNHTFHKLLAEYSYSWSYTSVHSNTLSCNN